MTRSSYRSRTSSVSAVLLFAMLVTLSFRCTRGSCHSVGAGHVKLSMQSHRNETGHRNVKVWLQTRAPPGGAAFGGAVDATQRVLLCEGLEVVDMVAVVTTAPVFSLPPGYEVFPGLGYYKFHTRAVVWDEAYTTCVREGTYLMYLHSEAESNVLKQFLGRKVNVEGSTWPGWSWAGFHDRGLEGDYVTVHGSPLNQTGYTKWHPGQPDNKPWGIEPDQDCGSFNKDALLNDLPCTGKLPFICAQPI